MLSDPGSIAGYWATAHPQSMAAKYTCNTQTVSPTNRPCDANFVSAMAYNRFWFFDDHLAFTMGGGMMHNPSRYLVLDPTGNASPIPQPGSIQGIQYIAPSNPYWTAAGSQFDAYDYEYGAVSQGVFAGSATEAEGEGYILNDIFIAIPVGGAPGNGTFTSSYQTGLLDFQKGGSSSIMNALFQLSPNGQGLFKERQIFDQNREVVFPGGAKLQCG